MNAAASPCLPSVTAPAWWRALRAPLLSAERSDDLSLDRADVAATLGGDHDAFERLVRRHQQALGRQLLRFTRDQGQREELLQDVFVEAYGSLKSYAGRGSLAAWLRTLCVRRGYRFWRDRDRERARRASPDAPLPPAPDGQDAREAAEWVHVLLAKLPPRDRLVLTLMYIEECSVKEAARLSGWSEGMVKVQAHRARKKLELLLASEARR